MQSLELVADLLWDGADVADPTQPAPAGGPSAASYLAVPSRSRPRYLLPLGIDRRAQRRLLMAYNDLRSPGRRLARLLLAQVAGRGLLVRGAGQRVQAPMSTSGRTLLEVVAEAVGTAAGELTMAVGVNDKGGLVRPTITVADRSGLPLMFVKVARHAELQVRLKNEFRALQEMEQHPVDGIVTPRALLLEDWAGRKVLGVSPLPLESVGMRFRHRDEAERFLHRMQSASPAVGQVLGNADWLEALRARTEMLQSGWRSPLHLLQDRLVDRHGHEEILIGRRHGDWSPWNMARLDDGRIAVWDWEFHQSAAPQCLDWLNWVFAYATSVRRVQAEVAAHDLAERHRDDPLGVLLFLLDMAVRRAEEAACGLESSAAASLALQAFLRRQLVSDRQ